MSGAGFGAGKAGRCPTHPCIPTYPALASAPFLQSSYPFRLTCTFLPSSVEADPTIIYTKTDEAPALATYSFLPIVQVRLRALTTRVHSCASLIPLLVAICILQLARTTTATCCCTLSSWSFPSTRCYGHGIGWACTYISACAEAAARSG